MDLESIIPFDDIDDLMEFAKARGADIGDDSANHMTMILTYGFQFGVNISKSELSPYFYNIVEDYSIKLREENIQEAMNHFDLDANYKKIKGVCLEVLRKYHSKLVLESANQKDNVSPISEL